MIRINSIIAARMSSERLPGKVLMDICGKPMLQHVIEQSRISWVDNTIVATSVEKQDDPIETVCNQLRIPCVRGSLTDVYERYWLALNLYPCNYFVRLTADCPLCEPFAINTLMRTMSENPGHDYYGMTTEDGYPDGSDVELFNSLTFMQTNFLVTDAKDREHINRFVRRYGKTFIPPDCSGRCYHETRKYSVDTIEDLEYVRGIIECVKREP